MNAKELMLVQQTPTWKNYRKTAGPGIIRWSLKTFHGKAKTIQLLLRSMKP